MIWKILFQILAVLVALLTASLDYLWRDKRTLKFKRTRIILFFCSIALLVVSIVAVVYDQYQNDQEIEQLTRRLDRITNELTGGDSYCYVQYTFPVGSNNTIAIWLMNDRDYPLFDTQVRMVDLDKFSNLQLKVPMPESEIKKTETLFSVGVIGPHSVIDLGNIQTPPEKQNYGFNVWIHTRYKEFFQEARFKRVGGRWRLAHRLFEQTNQGSQLIFEKIPKDIFPQDSTSTWDYPTAIK